MTDSGIRDFGEPPPVEKGQDPVTQPAFKWAGETYWGRRLSMQARQDLRKEIRESDDRSETFYMGHLLAEESWERLQAADAAKPIPPNTVKDMLDHLLTIVLTGEDPKLDE